MKDSDQERFTSRDFIDEFDIKRGQATQALRMLRKKKVIERAGRAEPKKYGRALIVYEIADEEAVLPKPVTLEI